MPLILYLSLFLIYLHYGSCFTLFPKCFIVLSDISSLITDAFFIFFFVAPPVTSLGSYSPFTPSYLSLPQLIQTHTHHLQEIHIFLIFTVFYFHFFWAARFRLLFFLLPGITEIVGMFKTEVSCIIQLNNILIYRFFFSASCP